MTETGEQISQHCFILRGSEAKKAGNQSFRQQKEYFLETLQFLECIRILQVLPFLLGGFVKTATCSNAQQCTLDLQRFIN